MTMYCIGATEYIVMYNKYQLSYSLVTFFLTMRQAHKLLTYFFVCVEFECIVGLLYTFIVFFLINLNFVIQKPFRLFWLLFLSTLQPSKTIYYNIDTHMETYLMCNIMSTAGRLDWIIMELLARRSLTT